MKEHFIKNAQQAFLRDTIEFYNINNRCVWGGACQYSPTEISPGCAIGRHLPNKAVCRQLDLGGYSGALCVDSEKAQPFLGPLLVLETAFLSRVQALHDMATCWDADGLSLNGRQYAEKICYAFDLDPSKVFPTSGVTSRITPQAQDTATT